MEFLINCEDPDILKEYLHRYPVIDGITTNPLMISRAGDVNFFQFIHTLREIAQERILMVQVTSPETEDMLREADLIREAAGEETYVKIPAVPNGIRAIDTLKKQGCNVTATVVGSFGQGMAALKAGADYIALFFSPMENNQQDAEKVVRQLRSMLDNAPAMKGKILAAGCKTLEACGRAIQSGADAITVGPDVITSGLNSIVTEQYMNNFRRAWDKVHGANVNIMDLPSM